MFFPLTTFAIGNQSGSATVAVAAGDVFAFELRSDVCLHSIAATTTISNFSAELIGAGCPQEYTITRTWTATDDCGNTTTCEQTITLEDTTAPVITCPADVVVECTESTLPGQGGLASATATDNCDLLPVVTFSDVTASEQESCIQEYTITRTWTAQDACGNSSVCVQIITVDDSTAPVITCPADMTLACTESTLPLLTGSATATDNCELTPVVFFSDVTIGSGVCPQEYTISRTWTATDACGNSSSCVQTLTIEDNVAPVITTCPSNIFIECDESTLPGNTGMAAGTDNCDAAPLVSFSDVTAASGICPQEYLITRMWTIEDACGNSSTCLQIIVVDDTTPPEHSVLPT